MKEICFLVLFTAYYASCSSSGNPLYLTPLIESGKLEEAKKASLVRSSQFRCSTVSYSGFLTVEKKYNSNIFFWFFKSKDPKAPVILWLEGGPELGALGPFLIKKNLNLQCSKNSWTKAFSVVYIDSPVGSGFSFTESDDGYSKTHSNVTDNLYIALKQFFTLFEEQRTNEIYIASSSYSGKYVPSLAYRIHKANENIMNLKGLAIGNGFIDPFSSLAYGPHLYQFGLIDEKQKNLFDEKEKEIQSLIATEQYEQAFDKRDVLITKMLYKGETIFEKTTGYSNYYDVRATKVESPGILVALLTQNRTRKALHVGNVPFVLGGDNNEPVIRAMRADICRSVKPIMGELMENFKVLLYNGNMDIILPGVIGNQFLKTLQWKHLQEYLSSSRSIWRAERNDTEVAGYIRKVQKFRELVVRNAGHLAISDQPRVAFHMITQFVANEL